MGTQKLSDKTLRSPNIASKNTLVIVDDPDHERSSSSPTERAIISKADFTSCDNIVRSGLSSFRAVGTALRIIKMEKLWKGTTETWTEYCLSISVSRVQANRLIFAAEVAQMICDEAKRKPGLIARVPISEWQLRPLTKAMLDRDQVAAWKLAIELADGENPSEKDVKAAVRQTLGDEPEKKPEKQDKQALLTELVSELYEMLTWRENGHGDVSFILIEAVFRDLKSLINRIV